MHAVQYYVRRSLKLLLHRLIRLRVVRPSVVNTEQFDTITAPQDRKYLPKDFGTVALKSIGAAEAVQSGVHACVRAHKII